MSVGQCAKCQCNHTGTEGTEQPELLSAAGYLAKVHTLLSAFLPPQQNHTHFLCQPSLPAEWLATLAEKRQTGVALSRDLNLQLPQLIQQERKAQRTVPQTTEPDSTAMRLPACFSREQNKLLFISANVALVSTNTAPHQP